jgi:hypothetical protein
LRAIDLDPPKIRSRILRNPFARDRKLEDANPRSLSELLPGSRKKLKISAPREQVSPRITRRGYRQLGGHKGRPPIWVYDELKAHFSEEEIIELALLCAQTDGVGKFAGSLKMRTWEESLRIAAEIARQEERLAGDCKTRRKVRSNRAKRKARGRAPVHHSRFAVSKNPISLFDRKPKS